MKRIFYAFTLLAVMLSIAACSLKPDANKNTDIYAEGYSDGYLNGSLDAQREARDAEYDVYEIKCDALKHFDNVLKDELYDINFDIERKFGMYPEKAVMVLYNYYDDPEGVDEEDLITAIFVVDRYYSSVNELLYSDKDFWID